MKLDYISLAACSSGQTGVSATGHFILTLLKNDYCYCGSHPKIGGRIETGSKSREVQLIKRGHDSDRFQEEEVG
jgi:hypothetical protein